MVTRMSAERALKEAIKQYQQSMQLIEARFPITELELSTAHNKAYEEAVVVFRKEANISEKQFDVDTQQYFNDFNRRVADWQAVTSVLHNSRSHAFTSLLD